MQPEEIITAPFTIWIAPVGTAFPALSAEPGEAWTRIGSNGNRNYSEDGVIGQHIRRNETTQPAGNQAPSNSFTSGEEYRVRVQLLDMTLEQYAHALGANAVSVNPAATGVSGFKVIGLSLRVREDARFALLIRGPSPYIEGGVAQFELPIVKEAGAGPQTVFRRGSPVGIAIEFVALENPDATSADQLFGRLVAEDESIPLGPEFTVAPTITGSPVVGQTLTGVDGTVINGSVSARQWLRDGVEISGATSGTYTLVEADEGADITFRVTAIGAGGTTQATSAAVGPVAAAAVPITAVAADGWQATATTPTDPPTLQSIDVTRQGFDATGGATTIADTVKLTKRVRQAYPNQASFTTDQVALSERIMAADSIAGVTNNSTLVSPRPIAAWVMADRLTVGDSVDWEIAAFHYFARAGKQVACVKVRANDGTTQTAWQTVSSTTLSTRYDDAIAPEVYAGTLDISGLADGGLIWLEAEVYPHFGTTASVLKSEDIQPSVTNQYEFARRYFRRDTALAAAPPYAYVSSTGNDGTGVISTTAATAEASPFLTVAGVLAAARTQLGTTTGDFDNLHIRIMNTVTLGAVAFNTYWQDIGAVIVERDPNASRATAIVDMVNEFRPRWSDKSSALTEGSIIFRDVTLKYGAAVFFKGETANHLYVQFIDCAWDLENRAGNMRSAAHFAFFGGTWANMASANFAHISATQHVRMVRGIAANVNDQLVCNYVTIGCEITGARDTNLADPANDGIVIAFNKFLAPSSTRVPIQIAGNVAGGNIGSFAIVQNLVEFTSTTSGPSIKVSADSQNGNVVNGVMHHNTCTGDDIYGRWNLLYDEHPSVARTHTFFSCKGNLGPQLNTKGDDFILDGTRTGNFAFEHGVGCAGNFTEDVAAGGDNFRQAYGGVGSVIAGGDPLYTNDQSTDASGPVAGSGGGTYTLGGSSPARDIFSEYLLGRDIAGNARATSGTIDAGAYA